MKITKASEDQITLIRLIAIDVFGNETKAVKWLDKLPIELHGQTPMSIIHTNKGF